MSSFQQKNYEAFKKQENITNTPWKQNREIETAWGNDQISDFTQKRL